MPSYEELKRRYILFDRIYWGCQLSLPLAFVALYSIDLGILAPMVGNTLFVLLCVVSFLAVILGGIHLDILRIGMVHAIDKETT